MFCCGSRSLADVRSEKARATNETDARHARVASVLSPPPRVYIADRPLSYAEDQEAPPAYSASQSPPNPYTSPGEMRYDQKDEKQAIVNATETIRTSDTEEQLLSPRYNNAFSDTSSVISTPSTQVTGLGSVYTARYVRRGSSGRDSDEYSTRPPTYYERSITRRSSASSTNTGTARILSHPVMRDGWFENINADSRNMYGE